MCSPSLTRGVALACLLAAASQASASGLQVAPTSLELAASGPAQALWLTNTGDHALHAQVRAYKWSQASGKDDLAATQDVVASPPMLDVPAGGRQLVRVIRTGAAAAGEQTYRLLVDELPVGGEAKQTGVQYVLRYSVPVFVGASGTPSLQWSTKVDNEGLKVEIHNSGTAHAQVSYVSLQPAGGAPVEVVPGLLGYVLPGATMHWTVALPAGANAANASLKALVNGQSTEQTLSPGAPAR
ncbi:MAG TPA: molecular chaperone [Rhodanobacteraceae bacterium]|nr:molecular chaperone [Rhodanobacteraceae bacterium]